MNCSKCGQELYEGMSFCDNCGQPVPQRPRQQPYSPNQQPYASTQQPYSQQPYASTQQPYTPVQQSNAPAWQPVMEVPQEPVQEMPMKWFKFLIYFALFAGAVMNVINGFSLLTGTAYEGNADAVYRVFPDLKAVDMLCGVLSLGLAAFGIFTRFQLSGYRRQGPTMLLISYVAVFIYDLVYIFGVRAAIPAYAIDMIDFTPMYSNIAVSVVMVFVNYSYFKKRSHLFVN